MKVYIFAGLLVVAVSASLLKERKAQFHAFKLKHGKTYKNKAEEVKRFNIFKDKLRAIEEHNALYGQGLVSYKKGVNQFTDITQEVFRTRLRVNTSNIHLNATKHVTTGLAIPTSVDWRTGGQVTGVKDQGNCHSSWAFSVTGSTEAAYFRKTGQLISFSEQQLVDCTYEKINYGCRSGIVEYTFQFVEEVGLVSEVTYPYKGRLTDCDYDHSLVITKISSYTTITSDNENALLDAVANVGPVSVEMDASHLFEYESGIFTDKHCDPYELGHGALIIGYGSENGTDYWIVKSSWGESWGENGYFRIVRGEDGCNIEKHAMYPTV